MYDPVFTGDAYVNLVKYGDLVSCGYLQQGHPIIVFHVDFFIVLNILKQFICFFIHDSRGDFPGLQ